jgi:hypothetical protein
MVRKKKLELSSNNRQSAFLVLWNKLEDGRLPHGALREVAEFFSVDRATISRLWRAVKNKIDEAVNNQNGKDVNIEKLLISSRLYKSGQKSTGRHKKWDCTALKEAVRQLRLTDRQNFV